MPFGYIIQTYAHHVPNVCQIQPKMAENSRIPLVSDNP